MRISYRREMRHNYLILDPEDLSWKNYECRMMANNRIEGVLRFQLRQMDHEVRFYYEITSRQPLTRMLEGRDAGVNEIRSLVLGIAGILEKMDQYLLREGIVMLDPEYIYVEPDTFRIWLCLVPGLERKFPKDFGKLLEYLLGKVNHEDKESVILAYGLYQETRKENYGMEDILCFLQKEGTEVQKQRMPNKEEEEPVREPVAWTFPDEGKNGQSEQRGSEVSMRKEKPVPRSAKRGLSVSWSGFCATVRKLFFRGAKERVTSEETAVEREIRQEAVDARGNLLCRGISQDLSVAAPAAPWESMFASEGEETGKTIQESLPASDVGMECNTILLADADKSRKDGVRRLQALSGENPDIILSYYPFIIGKQENLSDFVLNYSTVSRLHVRIDRQGNDYLIQDLNSTNGTVVSGQLLENNETVRLNPGDEVWIADQHYRFQ
ncbi:MAG: FHA domain-containing protein [Clostridiales bacterium]|nr:FHA domain-containing protein [Clostridiales bacterium]